METMQWSDAARIPRNVAAAVETNGEVLLERRGDVPFVVMRADRADEARQGMESSARLMQNILAHHGSAIVQEALAEVFSWSRFLPPKDQAEFTREFVWTLEACSELDMWAPLGRMIREWRTTAMIHSDPVLAASLSRAVDADLGPVPPPESVIEDGGAGAEER